MVLRRNSEQIMPEPTATTSQAPPAFTVPDEAGVVVEHPCIIKNLERGMKSLGGDIAIDRFLNSSNPEKQLDVSLRPEDPQARVIASKSVSKQSLLLKVTVPKWTGRKRKRGSNGAFVVDELSTGNHIERAPQQSRPDILRTLQDNPDNYIISPVSQVSEHHRFRTLPDYQYANSTDPLSMMVRDTLLTGNYADIKNFVLDLHKGVKPGLNVGFPPFMNLQKTALPWAYKQSPHVKVQQGENGKLEVVNLHPPIRLVNQIIAPDAPSVPMEPPSTLEPESNLDRGTRLCIAQFKKVLKDRPIMVRRVQEQMLPGRTDSNIRRAWPYVGYMFKQGPFRDAIIRYGVDPRTDPKYRFYQTLFFQLPPMAGAVDAEVPAATEAENNSGTPIDSTDAGVTTSGPIRGTRKRFNRIRTRKATRAKNSHIFDGTKLHRDGKTWQVCDIRDPTLLPLINADESMLRTECDVEFSGWYGNGTLATLRVLMKEKISVLASGAPASYDLDAAFMEIISIVPPTLTQENIAGTYTGREGGAMLVGLTAKIRSLAMLKARAKEGREAMARAMEEEEGRVDGAEGDGDDDQMDVDPALLDADVSDEDEDERGEVEDAEEAEEYADDDAADDADDDMDDQ